MTFYFSIHICLKYFSLIFVPQVFKTVDVLREQVNTENVLQVQPTRAVQLLHSLPNRAAQLIQEQESMNTSVSSLMLYIEKKFSFVNKCQFL